MGVNVGDIYISQIVVSIIYKEGANNHNPIIEFLNTLAPSNLPLSKLKLTIGFLCNKSRMMMKNSTFQIIQA